MKLVQLIKYTNGEYRVILFSPLLETIYKQYRHGEDYTIPPIEIDIIEEKDIIKK